MPDNDDLNSDFDNLLDDFLNKELSSIEDYEPSDQAKKLNEIPQNAAKPKVNSDLEDFYDDVPLDNTSPDSSTYTSDNQTNEDDYDPTDDISLLASGEQELIKAYRNFFEAVQTIADINKVKAPKLSLKASMLIPNYKPTIGKILSKDVLCGWDMLLTTNFEELKDLDMSSSDDGFLNYAEKLNDPNLQFAIVSYVEILIELESCEISYEDKKIRARKRRIEKEFMEEQRKKNERKKHFIEVLEAKHFPIDATRLITNYLKTANKDAKGAFKALTENPAMYAPIEMSKIKPRLFGLIKKSPKDGIRMNKKIGKFLKKMRA